MSVTNYLIRANTLLQNCKAAGIEQLPFQAIKGRLDWSIVKNAIPARSWPTVYQLFVCIIGGHWTTLYPFVISTLDC